MKRATSLYELANKGFVGHSALLARVSPYTSMDSAAYRAMQQFGATFRSASSVFGNCAFILRHVSRRKVLGPK